MIREAGHEDGIYKYGDDQAGEGHPDGVSRLAGEFVPHIHVEEHSQHQIGHQHHRGDGETRAEVLAQQQPDLVHIEHHEEEGEHAEGHEVVHHLGIEFLAPLFLLPLEEEGLRSVAEHLDEE